MSKFFRFLDESPAWLLAKGRFDDAIKIVKKIKRMNKLEDLDIDSLYDPGDDETTAKAGEKWRTVFTSKILILNILINCFGWYVTSQISGCFTQTQHTLRSVDFIDDHVYNLIISPYKFQVCKLVRLLWTSS